MPRFEIVQGKMHHCGRIVRTLREEHKAPLINLGLNPHHQLRICFDDSAFCKAWLIDGKLAGIGGVTGPFSASDGYIWLALSQEATHYPIEIIREARRQLEMIMQTKRFLTTSLIDADRVSVRFAERLGFKVVSKLGDWGVNMVYGEGA